MQENFASPDWQREEISGGYEQGEMAFYFCQIVHDPAYTPKPQGGSMETNDQPKKSFLRRVWLAITRLFSIPFGVADNCHTNFSSQIENIGFYKSIRFLKLQRSLLPLRPSLSSCKVAGQTVITQSSPYSPLQQTQWNLAALASILLRSLYR